MRRSKAPRDPPKPKSRCVSSGVRSRLVPTSTPGRTPHTAGPAAPPSAAKATTGAGPLPARRSLAPAQSPDEGQPRPGRAQAHRHVAGAGRPAPDQVGGPGPASEPSAPGVYLAAGSAVTAGPVG